MQKALIGMQMMMVKETIKTEGVYTALKKIREIGYRAVEVSQIDMTEQNVKELQKAQEELGIIIAAMSCGITAELMDGVPYPGDSLENNFDKIVADCKAVNCPILRIGMLPFKFAFSFEKMMELAQICEDYAVRLKEHGIDLYYHAHNMEFYRHEGVPALTHMKNKTKALGFELDTHWMHRGCVNIVEYLHSFKGRIRATHLKDYKIVLPGEGFRGFADIEHYGEVGEGCIDFVPIISAAVESGCEFLFVEQDDFYGDDVYTCLKRSYDNLVKMGYGDWF